jgi:predicted nuclease of predicted toxin-antitoxin system
MAASASTSRKRSGANYPLKPPEPPTFFLDRSLGRIKLATALRQAGLNVEVHDDSFAQDAADEEWLAVVGKNNWIVLTKDERIRYHPRELHALIAHGVRAFVLTARNASAEEMAAIVLRAHKRMEKFLSTHSGPFMVAIARSGSLNVLWPKPGSKK